MSSLEELQRGLWGDKYEQVTRKVVKTKKKKEKPVGFYKDEKGKTRPVTKPKPSAKRKTRVVRKVVPASAPTPHIPSGTRGAHGWEFDFPSSSKPGVTYTTTFWTEDHKQFKEGDVTCNCPGWRFRRTCRHVEEVEQMAGVKAIRGFLPSSSAPRHRCANASRETQIKFKKAVKGQAYSTGLPGFYMDPTHVSALLMNAEDAIKGASKDIAGFVETRLGGAPDARYRRITQTSLGKSVKGATDPRDGEWVFIGDTTYGKEPLKVALKTLGGRNIRVYSMGKDQPVWLMNDADEAVIIAPGVGKGGGFLRLEDIAA